MIFDQNKTCQHGIQYNQQSQFCFHVACKYERRLTNKQCPDCSIHQHEDHKNNDSIFIVSPLILSSYVYQKLCNIEFSILNQKNDLDFVEEQIQYAASLIKNYLYIEIISDQLIFKSLQIIQILQQQQQHDLDKAVKQFEQLIHKQNNKSQLNLIESNDKYQITKIHIGLRQLRYLAISPNEKYLLIGAKEYMYLYDMQTKMNKKVYKFTLQSKLAQFSQNSNKIIQATDQGIQIFDIQTNKMQYLKCKNSGDTKQMYLIRNSLYLIQTEAKQKFKINTLKRLIKFDLISSRQVYAYNLREIEHEVYFYQDLITYQSNTHYYIFNDSTRKSQLQINLKDYQIKKLIILNRHEILSQLNSNQLRIWNIYYEINRLVIEKGITLNATDVFRTNPIYGYFYLVLDSTLQIINQQYDLIYSGKLMININEIIKWNYRQFNSDKIFFVFQKDWLCLLERFPKN